MRKLAFVLLFFASVANAVTVNWNHDGKNTDGSSLTDLAGFRVYYGTSKTTLTQIVTVANPAARSTTFAAPSGAYFAVTAYTVSGAESVDSTIVSTAVVTPPPPPPPTPSGSYSYEATGTTTAPTMSAIGLLLPGATCSATVRQVGATKFCQITRAQTDIVGWPADKTLAGGIWAKAQ